MNMLFLMVFVGLGLAYLMIGLFFSRGIKNNEDYFLAGRNLGLIPLTFTLIATQLGGGMVVGTAAKSYLVGYWGLAYVLGISLGFLILGFGIAAKLRDFNIVTTAELFEVKYGSKMLRKLASMFSIFTLFGILGAQVVALKGLLQGLGFDATGALFLVWLFIIIYTVLGGLKAVAATDTFQVFFLFMLLVGVFVYSLFNEPASFFSFKNILSRQDLFDSKLVTFSAIFPVIFNTMMFSLIEQDLAQRFFAAKNRKIAAMSSIIASIFLLSFAIVPVYFGMKGNLMGIEFLGGSDTLFMVLGKILNNLFMILVVCGIAAAITSTADSLLCAISSNICQDFKFSILRIKSKLRLSQTITFIVGFLALFIAYIADDVIGILTQSYELSVSCLFVPIVFCYFTDKLKKNAALFSIIFGIIGFILFRFYVPAIPKEILTLLLSFIGYLIGNKFESKKMNFTQSS